MAVQEFVKILNKKKWIFLLGLSFSYLSFAETKKPLVQRAFIIEHQTIIYKEPDFNSPQLARLPRNRIVAISTKIYRPKNLFGSFYRIFINKPRKIRGYISQIDVVTQFRQNDETFVLNPEYQMKENVLRKVKDQILKDSSSKSTVKTTTQNSNKKPSKKTPSKKTSSKIKKIAVHKNRWLGAVFGWQIPLFGVPVSKAPLFFGAQFTRPVKFMDNRSIDFRFSFSPQAPLKVYDVSSDRGLILEGHIFPLIPVVQKKIYRLHIGGGLAWKWSKSFSPKWDEQLQFGPGVLLDHVFSAARSFNIRMGLEYSFFFNAHHLILFGGAFYSF